MLKLIYDTKKHGVGAMDRFTALFASLDRCIY